MDENTRKYVAKYVEDMHSLVTHGLQPFSQQVGEAGSRDHPEAHRAIQRFHETLKQHVDMLENRLQALGTSPTTGVQDAAAAAAGVVAGAYNKVRTEAVSKSLRDDYTFISHCGMAWLMLGVTARSLGDHDTEEMAEQGYRDCAIMAMEIDRLMPTLVVQEMRQDKLPAQDVSEWADRIVREAWQPSSAGASTGACRRPCGTPEGAGPRGAHGEHSRPMPGAGGSTGYRSSPSGKAWSSRRFTPSSRVAGAAISAGSGTHRSRSKTACATSAGPRTDPLKRSICWSVMGCERS